MTDEPREREERVAVLSGDRLCVSCGYNLTGQMIVREPHHALLIARCPECGTVASIQEYPLLGRWAARWGVVLATLWFVFILGAWPGSAALILGFTVQTAEQGAHRYGDEIRRMYGAARQSAAPATPLQGAPAATIRTSGAGVSWTLSGDFDLWWKDQDRAAVLAGAGGWFEAVDWRAMWTWLPAALVTFALGWFWSMALLHLRRHVLVLWGCAVLALAAVFVAIVTWDWRTDEYARAWNAGRAQLGPPLLVLTLAWCGVALMAGLVLGRSASRLAIRCLLCPRFRGPLAVVWTADGLPPPGSGAKATADRPRS